MNEIQEKTPAITHFGWKRRLRDFLSMKNTDLLDFMKLSVPSHPVIGPAETLLRRFGNPNVTPKHPSVRDIILDASGSSATSLVSECLSAARGDLSGVEGFAAEALRLYNGYQEAGDELLKLQASLKEKLDKLDRIQGKLSLLLDIDPTESFEPLMSATESFMKKIFDENTIESDYLTLIESYRKFAAFREALQLIRAPAAIENEPLCSICLHDTVGFTITPCGHTFCQTCVRKQITSCFICRGQIRDRVKIYFG
jgi:hypothetical protein